MNFEINIYMGYFDSDFAVVEYDESCDAIVARLEEFEEGESFRNYMNTIIEAVEDRGTNKVLSDTSQFDAALSPEDQGWSVEDWTPRAVDAGVDQMAMVMPESVLAEMSVDSILEATADDGINRNVFDNVEDAREWLADV